VEEEGMY